MSVASTTYDRAGGDVGVLERWFGLSARGTTAATEVRAGLTTFMVMSYIVVVNAAILTTTSPDLPFAAVVTATCLVAGVMTLAMGLYANMPLAIAPGMGLNAVVAFQLVAANGLPWQAAMGVIFVEGLIITALVLTGFREAVMTAMPHSLKLAIGGGIGLFLLAIGAYEGGLYRVPAFGPNGAPPPTAGALGNLVAPPAILALIGLGLTAWFLSRGMRGGLLLGILATTVIGIIWHYAFGTQVSMIPGKAELPALLTLTIMPLTWSITNGIGAGIVLYAFLKVIRGRARDLHPLLAVVALAFVVYFIFWRA